MAQAKKKKGSSADRPGQADPTAPLDGGELLVAARPVLELLREDLGKRAEDVRVERALRTRYEGEKTARRTADSFAEWRDGLLAPVAASWFLSCMFVRTLADRGLLGQARIAGPGATDSQTLFVQLAPSLTERDYLLFVFRELAELPAARDLFDREHAMVWHLSPSADAAKELLRLFRTFVLVRHEDDIWAERSLMCFVPAAVDERETLALLAYLNSSVVCAWIRKRVPPTSDATPRRGKGMGRTSVAYRLAGGLAEGIPVPQALLAGDNASILASLFSAMDVIATALERTPETAREKLAAFDQPRAVLAQLENEIAALIGRGVVVQEEIDWTIYRILFGTKTVVQSLDELLTSMAPPHVRPFCTLETAWPSEDSVGLAPAVAGEWENRRVLLRADEILQDVERKTFKRQWSGRRGEWGRLATESQRIATDVLMARIDEVFSCSLDALLSIESPEILNRLYAVDGTGELLSAFSAREDVSPEMALDSILQANSVPFLDALIFAESGLAKQRMWRSIWSQYREGGVTRDIPSVFESADFLESRYWSLRGRRNLCQEIHISYPACQSDENGQLAYGWAGWNHLQQAKALASLYQKRKTEEGWTVKRLVPMLAGLLELLPWVKQWHNEPNPEFDDQRMGDFFAQFLDGECQSLGLTYSNLEAWRPSPATKKSKTVGTQATSDDTDDSAPPPAKRTRKKGKA